MSDKDRTQVAQLQDVFEVIDNLEAELLEEDMMGASRNDVVEGTCQRIKRRLREEHERESTPCEECGDPIYFDSARAYFKTPDERFWHPECLPEEYQEGSA